MRALTTSEKFGLIRDHGNRLSAVGMSISVPKRSDVIESAQRIIELIKSVPKAELGIE